MLYLCVALDFCVIRQFGNGYFFQISLFLNGQHVETFEEDLTFTSDEPVPYNPPKIDSELKGMFIFSFSMYYLKSLSYKIMY